LGFLLYGALYAAIGSMCSAIQDSQQYASLVTMLILVGFFSVFAVIAHPAGALGSVLSWIPFFAPFVMPVRWSLTSVSAMDMAGSLPLLVPGMLFCTWLAARIYPTGILMFGKQPTWRGRCAGYVPADGALPGGGHLLRCNVNRSPCAA